MVNQNPQQRCQSRVTEKAIRDSFLGRHDETELVTESLKLLEDNLLRLENDIGSRLSRPMDEIKVEFEKLVLTISEAKNAVQHTFHQLLDAPRNPRFNKQASLALDNQIQLLSRRVRPKILRVLDKLSPAYKSFEKPLMELDEFRSHSAKNIVELIYLLRCRNKPEQDMSGKSVFELEMASQIDYICKRPFLSAIRFRSLRSRFRRQYYFTTLPLKAITIEGLIVCSELNPNILVQRHSATHSELHTRLVDAWRSIRYNMETAATELDDLHDDLRSGITEGAAQKSKELYTLVFSALNNCLETFDDISVIYASFITAVLTEITQDHQHALTAIRRAVEESSSFKARFRWWRKSVKRSYLTKLVKLRDSSKRGFISIYGLPSQWHWFVRWRYIFSTILKRQHAAKESLLKLADLPTQDELLEHAKSLPPVYRRLFQSLPLNNREFLVGMDGELNILKETLTRWQSGRASSVAIVGPEGSGKTSLLNCFENELDEDIKYSRIELAHRLRSKEDVLRMLEDLLKINEPCDSVAEIIKKIQEMNRQIIVIEAAHQLFLRATDMREALDAFFYIMMATRIQVFWLLAFRLHPWMRIGYIFQAEQYFTHVINSEFHDEAELESALMSRQRATAQELLFSEEGVQSYRIRKLLTQYRYQDPPVQQALAKLYFANLFELSGGNMETALFYWLASLRNIDAKNIKVLPCLIVDTDFLKNLDTIYLFTLAEVLAHGGMTPTEHSDLFSLDSTRSRLILEYLRQIRMLKGHGKDRYDQAQSYTVNTIFYQPIATVLRSMHILY